MTPGQRVAGPRAAASPVPAALAPGSRGAECDLLNPRRAAGERKEHSDRMGEKGRWMAQDSTGRRGDATDFEYTG